MDTEKNLFLQANPTIYTYAAYFVTFARLCNYVSNKVKPSSLIAGADQRAEQTEKYYVKQYVSGTHGKCGTACI
jgi:hypothetical protein